jgi:large subunit ribosomal protein L16
VVKPGRILFEIGGVGEEAARGAIRLASYKLPIGTKFVLRETSVASGSKPKKKELAQVEG